MDRAELEAQLGPLIRGCPSGLKDACIFQHNCCCDSDVAQAMEWVDAYVASVVEQKTSPHVSAEAWDAATVAKYLGYRNEAAARAMMSRWGIKKVRDVQDERTGRVRALYPANGVRAEAIRRGRR